MKKMHTNITLLGLGLLLLLALLVHPLYAQSPGPSSAPVVTEAVEPTEEAPSEGPAAPIYKQSSAPILPDGSVAPAGEPFSAEEPLSINAVAAIANFRIPGTALKPRGNDVDHIPTASGGCFYASSGNSFRVFNTGLYLPQGSNILAMRMYYDDTSASNSRAWFSVYDLYGNLVSEWSVDSVGDAGNGFNDTDMISHTIDYLSYSYVVNWRPYDLGSDTQLCGFRIFYEPPPFGIAFLPMILRN